MNSLELVMAKVISAIGGTLGGLALMAYIRSRTFTEAASRGLISTTSAAIGATPLLDVLGKPRHDAEWLLFAGFSIGFCAWFLLGTIVRWMEKNKTKDVLQVFNKNKK